MAGGGSGKSTERDLREAKRQIAELEDELVDREQELSQQRELLRREHERIQSFMGLGEVLFVAMDRQGKVTLVNRKACEVLGYSQEEITGKEWFSKFLPVTIRDEVRKVFRRLMAGEIEPMEFFENPLLTASGEERLIAWHNTVMRDRAGEICGTLSAGADVTELKRAERERQALEQQLRQAQKMESIGRLAGGIAHDFNNLLTVINNYAQMVRDELLPDSPLQEDLGQIIAAGQRAADLTGQLLAFSRKQILEPRVLDINEVLVGILPLLERLLGEDIEIKLEQAVGLGHVRADRSQLEQVIMNLAVNARDAMPEGGLLVMETADVQLDDAYAAAHPEASPGPHVMLAISDSGQGMSNEVCERIFEPFFTTKEKGRGSGLGLSVVYGIVKQSGGNIWVYSEPGRGSTFKIYLPRVDDECVEPEQETAGGDPGGSETVLVVEDERAVRELVVRILRGAGYQVLAAQSAADVEQQVGQSGGRIDLLLTDVVMPGGSGKRLAELLVERHREMKVLFMSGYTDNAIVHHGVLEPGTWFIAKPFGAGELLRKVRQVLDET